MKMEFFRQDEVSDFMIEKHKIKKGDMKMRGGKLEPKAMAALKTMSQDEAKVLVQGLPANLRRSTMKELGIKEVVDGRTKAFRTTVERLITAKNKPAIDEADQNDKDKISPNTKELANASVAKSRAMVMKVMNKKVTEEKKAVQELSLKPDKKQPNLILPVKGPKGVSKFERQKGIRTADKK